MSAKVEFHRLALKEYDDACKWYAERSDIAEQRFEPVVDAAVSRISDSPESLAQFPSGYRWVRVQRFRYILVFRVRPPHEIVIVAVAHSSRRPSYWRRRA